MQKRWGNRSKNNAPRNTYQTRDGHWVAISTNSPAIVKRVLTLCGGKEVAEDPRFQTPQDRVAHINEIDGIVSNWISQHDLRVVIKEFEEAEAAIGPAYDISQIFNDPQFQARKDIIEITDEDLGAIKMTNAFPFLSETPAEVRRAGPRKGQHNREILIDELGLTENEVLELEKEGTI